MVVQNSKNSMKKIVLEGAQCSETDFAPIKKNCPGRCAIYAQAKYRKIARISAKYVSEYCVYSGGGNHTIVRIMNNHIS